MDLFWVSILDTTWGKRAEAPSISLSGKLNSRIYIGLWSFLFRMIVRNTVIFKNKIAQYVKVPRMKAGKTLDGRMSSDSIVRDVVYMEKLESIRLFASI